MSTVIYTSPIFGPVHSRRLGVSLGINLLPGDGKVCTFDCVYCECGYNQTHRAHQPLPTRQEVAEALGQRLREMHDEGPRPDVLTFAGNGEPTVHPDFAAIVDDVIRLRDRWCPDAKLSVLSNATRIDRAEVRQALLRFDNAILKLDTVSADYINMVDRPCGHYDMEEQLRWLEEMGERAIIQTLFMTGEHDGQNVDNTGDDFVQPWLDALKRIGPRQVMIYTIDRETPSPLLRKASPEQLDAIAARVRSLGIPCSASY
ncbi:MAG: radical SAM protein [Bacteroidales bacterium]|nr:radical SAM protein [Candidatus Physcousia equi]